MESEDQLLHRAGGQAAPRLSRRGFIKGTAMAAGVTLGGALLAACGSTAAAPSSPAASSAAPSSAAASSPAASVAASAAASSAPSTAPAASGGGAAKLLPTYVPAKGPQPDVPGTGVIPDGYASYPKAPVQTVSSPPGKGGDVTIVAETFAPLAPLSQNTLWQQLNKNLNVNLKLKLAPFNDYAFGTFQTTVAGGDLPDILFAPIGGVIPELPAFLDAKMQDLTPFLSGDNVKEYPNLAALPTTGWKGMVFNNKLYALPSANSIFYWALWGHKELLDAAKVTWPSSAADFKTVLSAVNQPQKNIYGIGFEIGNRYSYGLTPVGGSLWPAIYGAPNNWGVNSDGSFSKDWETEQFKAAVSLAREIYAAGDFDPNTSYTTPTADQAFQARKMAFRFDGAINFTNYDSGTNLANALLHFNPPAQVRLAPPIPAQAGGKGQYNFGIGNFGLVMLKKASSARIKELLNIINYLVAPFGSTEYLAVNYGVPGKDYNMDSHGNPARTKQGTADIIAWLGVVGNAPPVLYDSYNPEYASGMNASLKPLAAVGVYDPTVGLYSATSQKIGFSIQQKFADAMIGIVAGRDPLTNFDQAVKDWRAGGGDAIKKEFAQAYAASH